MTLPNWQATGTGSETSCTWPTHIADDFGILCVEHSNSGTTITTPSGWTPFPGMPVDPGATFNVCLSMFYRFATSNAEGAVTIAGTVNHKWGTIITYRGVSMDTPFHGMTTAFWGPAQTTISMPGITTLLNDCKIFNVLAWSNDDAGPLGSNQTNGALTNINERYDAGTVTAGGGGLNIWDADFSTNGTFGFSTIDMSSAALAAMAVVALCPADLSLPTLGRESRVKNTGAM